MTIQAHANAFLALLAADGDLTSYDGQVPQGAPDHYVLVYFADGDPELADSRPLTGTSERFVQRAICHCVGGNQVAARAVAQRVRALVLDVVPAVTGRRCMPIRREDGQPVQRDESTGRLVQDKTDIYRIESVPA